MARQADTEERRIVGTTVARAVRLEAAAEKGELIVDAETYDALPDDLKQGYGPEEIVAGKRAERFTVRRCALVSLKPKVDEPAIIPPPKVEAPALPQSTKRQIKWLPLAYSAGALAVGAILLAFFLNHRQPSYQQPTAPVVNYVPNGQFEDLTVRNLDSAARTRLAMPDNVDGVEVTAVKIDSSPYAAGMMPEDIITGISGQPVRNINDVVRLCSGSTEDTIAIQIWRHSDEAGSKIHVLTVNSSQAAH